MRSTISLTTALVLAGALGSSACGDDPSYTLRWRFIDEEPGPFSARNCGARGVESFLGTETSADGSRRTFRAVCGMGELRRSLPEGTWTVSLVGVDPAGNPPSATEVAMLTGTAGPFEVKLGGPEPIVEVAVPVRKECADGIDNDGDGLVDADDGGCQAGAEGEKR